MQQKKTVSNCKKKCIYFFFSCFIFKKKLWCYIFLKASLRYIFILSKILFNIYSQRLICTLTLDLQNCKSFRAFIICSRISCGCSTYKQKKKKIKRIIRKRSIALFYTLLKSHLNLYIIYI